MLHTLALYWCYLLWKRIEMSTLNAPRRLFNHFVNFEATETKYNYVSEYINIVLLFYMWTNNIFCFPHLLSHPNRAITDSLVWHLLQYVRRCNIHSNSLTLLVTIRLVTVFSIVKDIISQMISLCISLSHFDYLSILIYMAWKKKSIDFSSGGIIFFCLSTDFTTS